MLLLKRKVSSIFLIIAFLAIFAFGFWLGKIQVVCQICPPQEVDFSLFWETWNELHKNYVNPAALDTQKMIYGAIKGALRYRYLHNKFGFHYS